MTGRTFDESRSGQKRALHRARHSGESAVTFLSERLAWTAPLRRTYGWRLLIAAVRDFIADDCPTRASVIAYATLLSLFPMLLVILTVIGYLFANPTTRAQLTLDASSTFPGAGILIKQTVDAVVAKRGTATIFATLTLLWSASGAFNALNRNVNAIWRVPKERGVIESYLLAIFMVIAVALIFLVSLGFTALLQILHQFTVPTAILKPLESPVVYPLFEIALPALTAIGLFTLIYRFIPNLTVKWSAALAGGLTAGLLFEVGKQLFALYLTSFSQLDAVYGSIGALTICIAAFFRFFSPLGNAQRYVDERKAEEERLAAEVSPA